MIQTNFGCPPPNGQRSGTGPWPRTQALKRGAAENTVLTSEAVTAYIVSTERSVRMIRPGSGPNINYGERKPRKLTERLSNESRGNKIRRFGTLDMTPMRHPDFAYVTFHFPTVGCFEIYAVTPAIVKAAWKKMCDWIGKNVRNPITGKKAYFSNTEYQRSHCPHFAMALVVPASMEKRMIAQWRKVVGHPESLADKDVIHFERKDPEKASPEAAATYMAKPKGHQEIVPTEWSDHGWNPPGWWRVVGMEHLPEAITPIFGEGNIRGVNERMRKISDTPLIEFRNPKTGKTQKSFKEKWNKDSPKGSGEIRNAGDGLLIHDGLIALFGSEDDLAS